MAGTIILLLVFIGLLELWNDGRLSKLWQAADGKLTVKS